MAISFGPKLGLLYNALIGESYFDSLRLFLQSIDALVQGSVINATQSAPPTSPNPGDAYLLTGGTPSGAWTGKAGNIAVWDAQLTNSGTNTVVPGWIFLVPNAGWVIWNVALANLIVYNGSSWVSVTGGANFPTNTNITSMTGISNTTINSTGYIYNDGTNPATYIGDAASGGGAGPNGFIWGSGTFASPTTGTVIIGDGPWTGLDASGAGVGVTTSGSACVMTANGIQTSGAVEANQITSLGAATFTDTVSIGTGTPGSYAEILAIGTTNCGIQIAATNMTSVAGITLSGGGSGANTGLINFAGTSITQTTVGAAGGGSALPATPTGYLQIAINGSEFVIPYYAHA